MRDINAAMTIAEEIRRDPQLGAKRLESEYRAGLTTLARRLCHDPGDAAELVNRTFAEAIANIDTYAEQSAFFAWISKILVNLNAKEKRRESNQTVTYPGIVPDVIDEDAQEAIYANLDASLLRDAISELPAEMRDVVVMRYFIDLPLSRIAKILSVPEGTVNSRLHNAKLALAAKLGVAADKAKDAVNKPGVKATLLALVLCATAALGAVWWGEFSERAVAGETSGTASEGLDGQVGLEGLEPKSSLSSLTSLPLPSLPSPSSPSSPSSPPQPTTFSKEPTMNTTTLRTLAASAAFAAAPATSAIPAVSGVDEDVTNHVARKRANSPQMKHGGFASNAEGFLAAAVLAGGVAASPSLLAESIYTYENDNKTLVATVTSAGETISQAAINVLDSNTVTNFVKRGDKSLTVNSGGGSAFTGDVRIEDGSIVAGGLNPLGTSGTITVCSAKTLTLSGATIAKDVVLPSASRDRNTTITVWAGNSQLNGKLLVEKTSDGRNYCVDFVAYANARMAFAGGLEDEDTSFSGGYIFFTPVQGGTFVFQNRPVNILRAFYIKPNTTNYSVPSDGIAGRFVFDVSGNRMAGFGGDGTTEGYGLNWCELKTTADWAFDSTMKVYMGHDSVWDLCGTSQRIGQLDVKRSTGNISVITNSLATPATLHMRMMYNSTNGSNPPDIRFGGDLSVVFEGNIWDTMVGQAMTATGDLIVEGNGGSTANLHFKENGSWANATNIMVKGNGKITIANPDAFGKQANVDLASNSSLEIASGVKVCVRTLTVGGMQKPGGDYRFGDGILSVTSPSGFVLSIR